VRQGGPVSPTLFNIYLDEMITKRQKEYKKGIPRSKNQQLLTMLFADDRAALSLPKHSLIYP